MDAGEAYEFYAKPENQVPAGPAHRPRRPRGLIKGAGRAGSPHALDQVVSVRFTSSLLAQIRELADSDGRNLSDWIRDAASVEVQRRDALERFPGQRVTGWQCPHVNMTGPVNSVTRVTSFCGCEMQPIYEAVA